jgi:hypothetical protein
VLDDKGKLIKFISIGMEDDEIKRIAHPPVGKGLIGELMDTEMPLRVPVIQEHPRSSGFPAHHPKMVSFLGVPIRTANRQLGQIYLTEKVGAPEFTADDEKIIQMLAGMRRRPSKMPVCMRIPIAWLCWRNVNALAWTCMMASFKPFMVWDCPWKGAITLHRRRSCRCKGTDSAFH